MAFGPSSRRPQSCSEAEWPASCEGEGALPSSQGAGTQGPFSQTSQELLQLAISYCSDIE